MIFFQGNQRRNCVSANSTKRNFRLKREVTEPHQNKNNKKKKSQANKQNLGHNRQSYKAPLSCVDPFREQMKYLIEQNSQYFQNKVRITDKVRPNQYRFKIPTKTPVTMYRKNFDTKLKDLSVDNIKLNRNNISQIIKKKQPQQNLMFRSTYQNQFGIKKQSSKYHTASFSKQKIKKQVHVDQDCDIPRFLETQNKCFYLNWGGKNAATSLKPSYQTVSANFPFQGKTVYKNDFQGKSIPPAKIIIPQSSISKLSNSFMINKSCYSTEFVKNQKIQQVQKSYKPKNIPTKTGQIFKGSTQYSSEFIKNKQLSRGFSQEINKEDLHNFIMDL